MDLSPVMIYLSCLLFVSDIMDLNSVISFLRHIYLLQEWKAIFLLKKNFRGEINFYYKCKQNYNSV